MQVDINQSRSRAFNLFLRFMQLGLSLIAAIEIAKFDSSTCNNSFYKLIQACSILLALVSLFANLYFRCRDGFNKTFFFVILAMCVILAGITLIVAFAGYGQSSVCASNRITFKYMVTSIICMVIMSLFILFASFYWIQRYTNSPGNIVWVLVFLFIEWNQTYKTNLIVIGCLCLVVSLLTLTVNTVAALKGITTLIKKVIVFGWAIGLVIMFVNQIIAIAAYMQNSDHRDYTDLMAKKLLQIFVTVNVIEFALWLYGLLTLQHENGDMVRDSLLNFSSNRESEGDAWREDDGGQGIGTLK